MVIVGGGVVDTRAGCAGYAGVYNYDWLATAQMSDVSGGDDEASDKTSNCMSLCSVLTSSHDVSTVDVEAASAIVFPHEKPLNINRTTTGPWWDVLSEWQSAGCQARIAWGAC